MVQEPIWGLLYQIFTDRYLNSNTNAFIGQHLKVVLPEVVLFLVGPPDPIVPACPYPAAEVILDECDLLITHLEREITVGAHGYIFHVFESVCKPLELFNRNEERLTTMKLEMVLCIVRILLDELFYPVGGCFWIKLCFVAILAVGETVLAIQVTGSSRLDVDDFIHG